MSLRPPRKSPLVVVLIDDDLVSREVAATVLTMLGYVVHTAADGAAAVSLLIGDEGRPEPNQSDAILPDAILMDAQMPGLSGVKLIAALRARTSASIFVMSGSNPPHEVTAAADGFLLKPFSAEAVGNLLESSAREPAPSLLEAGDPVINADVLAQFRQLMPEPAVRKLYQTVVADFGRRIEALGEAMARDDVAEVRRIGHTIKGGCGMAGAVEAARLGALIETWDGGAGASGAGASGGDNQLYNREGLLRDLRTAARRLKNMLDAERLT